VPTAAPDRLRSRITAIVHAGQPIGGPVMSATVDTIVPLLEIDYGARVLDLGCGRAEWLIVLIDRSGCNGEGIDHDDVMLAEARRQAEYRLVDPQQLLLTNQDMRAFTSSQPYDAAICTGSLDALGGLVPALNVLWAVLRPGGRALVSERFWEHPPEEAAVAAVAATGVGAGTGLLDLPGTLAAVAGTGFVALYWHVSSQTEWDDYESRWAGSLEEFAIDNPADVDAPALLEIARRRRDGYLRGYRGSLGYVTCILAKPNSTSS